MLGGVLPLSGQSTQGTQSVPGAHTEAAAVQRVLARPDLKQLWILPEAQAQAQRTEAGLWANPSLGASRDHPNGPTGPRREDTFQIIQPVDFSGRRGLRKDAADLRLKAAEGDRDAIRAELVQRVRQTFHQNLLHQERLKRLAAAVDRVSRLAGALERQEMAGEASGAERRRAQRELDGLRVRLAQERAASLRAREQLNLLAQWEAAAGAEGHRPQVGPQGAPQDGAHEAAAGAEAPSPVLIGSLVPEAPPPLDEILKLLPEAPTQRRVQQEAQALDLEARASRRWTPDLNLGAGVKRWEEGGLKGSGAIFSLGVTLPAWNRGQAQRQRTEAEARAGQTRASLARDEARAEARALWREASDLGAAAREILGRAVEDTPRLLKGAEAAFEAGETGLFELLDVHRSALDTDLQALDLAFAARKARIDLDRLLGRIEP
ncbi:MAG: TolC family protein [Geothrix sp.]|nr:TolC family protein [Geothrix sp.]